VNFNNQIKNQVLAFFIVGVLIFIGMLSFKLWPEKITIVDLEKTPFSGKSEATSFVNFSSQITDSSGRTRAHKFILIFLALLLLFKPLVIDVINRIRISKLGFQFPVFFLKDFRLSRGVVFVLLMAAFLLPLLRSLFLFPDFSKSTEANMAVTNIHYTVIIGQADLLFGGFKLLDEVNPTYGAILPSLIGLIAKIQGKLLSLGGILKIVQVADILYWAVSLYLFWKWGKQNWAYMVPAVLFMLPWHYSTDGALVPINHSPIRTFGITFSLLFVMIWADRKSVFFYPVLGCVGSFALLLNVESGIASLVGIMAFLFVHLKNLKLGFHLVVKNCLLFLLGILSGFGFFNFVFFLVFGYLPSLSGWFNYIMPSLLGTSGAWTVPYKFDLWPIFIFLHVCYYFIINVISGGCDKHTPVRIMISVIFLVWFAYFVSRPDLEYLSSFYFIYGFVIIDLNRSLIISLKHYPIKSYVSLLPGLVVAFLLIKSSYGIEWSWNPLEWNVKNDFRWQVPLVKKGRPLVDDSVFYNRVYMPKSYWESLKMRSDFLVKQNKRNISDRIVFFTPDSYLLSRFANVYPYQIFSDPVVALKKTNYLKMIESVIKSPFDEIYFDARDEKNLIWYGWMFQMVSKDLSNDFEKVRVESGWEIWRRISNKN
jgi:hypothetical protein